ncbi:MAG: cob(I)yrinic acid a,c-diamide adenosyltransferase [Anaerolineales bacterium]|nr:cob(I)yrinic acid a,c-diamide adenosyltransferase [Anaerolineales bacterium]
MPRLTKIYTRTGDDGSTALGTRQRVPKDHPRVRAYGAVDELNSLLGVALAQGLDARLAETLPPVQNLLFHLGAELSFPAEEGAEFNLPHIDAKHIQSLEELIDKLNAQLGPLENFILPGGSPGAAALQLARAVCRRAERRLVTLGREETVRPEALGYLNRLSDALFVMARYENKQKGVAEPLWDTQA